MNILITGGAGFIGGAFARSAMEKGYKVTIKWYLENNEKSAMGTLLPGA